MSPLTEQQRRICTFVGSYCERNGVSPTYSEIGDSLGVTKQAVQYQVKALVELGFLEKPRDARSLRTTDAWLRHRRHQLDRTSNPLVPVVAEETPRLFEQFTDTDWESLYSSRGVGGALTREGVIAKAERINENRIYQHRAAELLENGEARQELIHLIDNLWNQVALSPGTGQQFPSRKKTRPVGPRAKKSKGRRSIRSTREEQRDDTGRSRTRD